MCQGAFWVLEGKHNISKVSIFLDSKGEGAKGRKGGMNLLCLSFKNKARKVSGFKYF